MWPFDAALVKERDGLRGQVEMLAARDRDSQRVIARQGERIQQLVALTTDRPIPNPRICVCPIERWERWRDGAIAGADGVVGTDDDDLSPNV